MSFTPNFNPQIVGEETTLFDYVGHTCACCFTNMTTSLSVETGQECWEVMIFDANEGILEVRQIGGADLAPEPDDWEKFAV